MTAVPTNSLPFSTTAYTPPGFATPSFTAVTKRDGRSDSYDRSRISLAIEMAFRAEVGTPYPDALDYAIHEEIERTTVAVENALAVQFSADAPLVIERIQDEVERQLMAAGHFAVARRFILYRDARAQRRKGGRIRIRVRKADGRDTLLEGTVLHARVRDAAADLGAFVDTDAVYAETLNALYDGIAPAEVSKAAVMAARARIERAPEYALMAARLLLDGMYEEAFGDSVTRGEATRLYRERFASYLQKGIDVGLLDPTLLSYDVAELSRALLPERDRQFAFMGVQTLYDRYLLHEKGQRFELPQWFWMRVSMGLALAEKPADRTKRSIEFYEMLSSFAFCSSTPTLFNAGTRHPQLSSCFLTTVQDDLGDIFKAVRDNALLSKWSGGLGNDWTNVRSMGSRIAGTNGESQGLVPFLKVANDTAIAVNQGGKRQGAVCAYLETWHLDIEEFLELRKNTGDDRRRTHDMHLANWIPDLFMERVRAEGMWTLFSPVDAPDLHDLVGLKFSERYAHYEQLADAGQLPMHKKVRAVDLWRRMLAMVFETGHPWLTWKDPSNLRSPQDHAGVVHSSNLCTEILLNTGPDEVAVCNLGSINLAAHVSRDGLDEEKLGRTVRTAVRMLDNVIDINLYPIPEAKASNMRHRPVGLGLMGFQDALYELQVSYASDAAVEFADTSMEAISWHALRASAELAGERGAYPSFPGSKWDRGLLPIDTLSLVDEARSIPVQVERTMKRDWTEVREMIRLYGMRNSNVMAIAPTATISNICDVTQSIEPTYKNLFAKSNLSGEFTIINSHLVSDLRALDLWDDAMVDDLKFHDGSVQEIERIPETLREKYLTAFEIEPEWLIECAARRQKWIDMGQSLNLYLDKPSGRRLNDMYMLAWTQGLKTTYYLRTLGAGGIEKSTIDLNKRGVQPRWMKSRSASADVVIARESSRGESAPMPRAACDIDGNCESCQ